MCVLGEGWGCGHSHPRVPSEPPIQQFAKSHAAREWRTLDDSLPCSSEIAISAIKYPRSRSRLMCRLSKDPSANKTSKGLLLYPYCSSGERDVRVTPSLGGSCSTVPFTTYALDVWVGGEVSHQTYWCSLHAAARVFSRGRTRNLPTAPSEPTPAPASAARIEARVGAGDKSVGMPDPVASTTWEECCIASSIARCCDPSASPHAAQCECALPPVQRSCKAHSAPAANPTAMMANALPCHGIRTQSAETIPTFE